MKSLRNLTFCSLMLAGFSLTAGDPPLPVPSSGTIERLETLEFKEIGPRPVDVWLPPDYSAEKKYAVIYMHDGQMLFDQNITWNRQEWRVDEILTRLMKEKKIRDCIVVAIHNTGKRQLEYFPQKPLEKLKIEEKQGKIRLFNVMTKELMDAVPLADAYLRFLVDELKPWIDSHYATLPYPANTFIAGSSMGGLISMYAICEYPDVFGGAACLSTHWPGGYAMPGNPIPPAFQQYMEDNLPAPEGHKFYFDYGTETLDAAYEPYQLAIDDIMRKEGFGPKQWMTRKFEGQDHSENAWSSRLDIPMEFLLTK